MKKSKILIFFMIILSVIGLSIKPVLAENKVYEWKTKEKINEKMWSEELQKYTTTPQKGENREMLQRWEQAKKSNNKPGATLPEIKYKAQVKKPNSKDYDLIVNYDQDSGVYLKSPSDPFDIDRINGYRMFREEYLKQLGATAPDYNPASKYNAKASYEAYGNSSNVVNKQLQEVMAEIDDKPEFVLPVGSEITYKDVSVPGYIDEPARKQNTRIEERDWQIYTFDLNKRRTKNNFKVDRKSDTVKVKVTEPGYVVLFLNVRDNAPLSFVSDIKDIPGQKPQFVKTPFETYSTKGNWRTNGGKAFTQMQKDEAYFPYVLDWHFVASVFKIEDQDKSNIKMAHAANNAYVEGNQGQRQYEKMEIREKFADGTVGPVINNKSCNEFGKIGSDSLCGYVEEGKTYEVTTYLQRSPMIDEPLTTGIKEKDVHSYLGAGFNIEESEKNFYNGISQNTYNKMTAMGTGGTTTVSGEKMKTEQIIRYDDKTKEYTTVAKTPEEVKEIFKEGKDFAKGSTQVYTHTITIPTKKSRGSFLINDPAQLWKQKAGKKGEEALPTLTFQSWLRFSNGATEEDKKNINNYTEDDWSKVVLRIKPATVDNRVNIPYITPEIPEDPKKPNYPKSKEEGICTALNTKDGENYTATLVAERLSGDGDRLENPELKVRVMYDDDKEGEILYLKPKKGSNTVLEKAGDKIEYELTGIKLKKNQTVSINAFLDHQDQNMANNTDSACFVKGNPANPPKPGEEGEPKIPDNGIIVEKIVPRDPSNPTKPGDPEDPREVSSIKDSCASIELGTNYDAIISLTRMTNKVETDKPEVSPKINVWVQTEKNGVFTPKTATIISKNKQLVNKKDQILYRVENINTTTGYLNIKAEYPYNDLVKENNLDQACFENTLDLFTTNLTINPKNRVINNNGCIAPDIQFEVEVGTSGIDAFDSKKPISFSIHKVINGRLGEEVYSEKVTFGNKELLTLRGTFKDRYCDPATYEYVAIINGGSNAFGHRRRDIKELTSGTTNVYDNNSTNAKVVITSVNEKEKCPTCSPTKIREKSSSSNRYALNDYSWTQRFNNTARERYRNWEVVGTESYWGTCSDYYYDKKGNKVWYNYGCTRYRDKYGWAYYNRDDYGRRNISRTENVTFREQYKARILYQDTNTMKKYPGKWIDITNRKVKMSAGQWFDIKVQDSYVQNRTAYFYNRAPLQEISRKYGSNTGYWQYSSPSSLSKSVLNNNINNRVMTIETQLNSGGKRVVNAVNQKGYNLQYDSYSNNFYSRSGTNFNLGSIKEYKIPNSRNIQAGPNTNTRKDVPLKAKNMTYDIVATNQPFAGYAQGYDTAHKGYNKTIKNIYDSKGCLVVCETTVLEAAMRSQVRAQIEIRDQIGLDTQVIGN